MEELSRLHQYISRLFENVRVSRRRPPLLHPVKHRPLCASPWQHRVGHQDRKDLASGLVSTAAGLPPSLRSGLGQLARVSTRPDSCPFALRKSWRRNEIRATDFGRKLAADGIDHRKNRKTGRD